jgi:hypothetical protein
MFIYMFPMIFQSLMALGKSSCDIFSGITQGWACLIMIVTLFLVGNDNRTNEMSTHCFEFVKLHFHLLTQQS